jgi:predicted MPP superfamily phosphohydrolase
MPYHPRSAYHSRPRRLARWLGRNWARLAYGRGIEPTWLELTRHEVAIPDLPQAFEGFRLVHLTDLHAGSSVCFNHLDRAIEVANAQAADLIALTGDFIHKGHRYIERVAAAVSRLSARHGVVAVLGNHDFAVRNALGVRSIKRLHRLVEEALVGAGIQVLRNRARPIQLHGKTLNVVGVDDLWSGACDVETAFQGLCGSSPRVLLAHNPRTVERLHGRRCDLILSGHTHGGQINWPGLGRFLLGRHGKRFAAGMYQYHNSLLYVNRGVGHGFRFRFGARPEVAVLHLRGGGNGAKDA